MFLLVAFAVNSHIICGRIFYAGRNLKMNRMLLIQVLLLFLCGCGDSWQATVYPNKNNLKESFFNFNSTIVGRVIGAKPLIGCIYIL